MGRFELSFMFVPTIKNSSIELPVSQLTDNIETLKISSENDTKANEASKDEPQSTNNQEPVATDGKVTQSGNAAITNTTPTSNSKEEEAQNSSETTATTPTNDSQPVLVIEEEEEEASIEVADHDKDRLIVTLPNGSRYETDRYCPHAGADLKLHGQISVDEYGPEVGPILMCSIHYWEFLLDKEGNSANGWSTLDACKLKDKAACPVETNGKLAW